MESLSAGRERLLGAIARRVVPELANADTATVDRFFAIIDTALLDRPEAMRRQVGAFLGLIRLLPVLRYGRPFEGLTAARQDRVLHWFQECPVGLLQQGFWGLRSLILMGWYGQPELWSRIGYEPVPDGNEHLHA